MNQIEVLVKEKSTGDQRTFTYKSFLDLQDRYELIGQCDEKGNLIPGDPNLSPRHQKVAVNDVAVHAVDTGMNSMSMEEKLAKRDELIKKFTPLKVEEIKSVETADEPKERKKPGPKPKVPA
ncbi:MAG TPA: hypothetical protein VFD46_14695 [Chryseolinea sp.]|nr:hypothetical protein [Chryseolinea sp.]